MARYGFFISIGLILLFPANNYAQQPQLVLPVGHQSSFNKLFFSADGSIIATTAFKDPMIALWDVKSGKLLTTFMDESAFWGFQDINFIPDWKKLLEKNPDNGKQLGEKERKRLLRLFDPDYKNDDDSSWMVIKRDQAKSIDFDGNVIKIFEQGAEGKMISIDCRTEVQDALLSNDGNKIAVATNDMIRIYHANSGKLFREWSWHGHIPQYNMLLSPSGKRIITYGAYVNIWDATKGTMLNSTFLGYDELPYENSTRISFAGTCDTFLVIKKGNWQIWDAVNAKMIIGSKKISKGNLMGVMSNDGLQAIILYRDQAGAAAELYNLAPLKKMKRFVMRNSSVENLSFLPGNKKIAISYEKENKTEIRDAGTFTVIKTIPGMIGGGFSVDGNKMITTSGKKPNEFAEEEDEQKSFSYVWDISSGRLIRRVQGYAIFSPTEDKIITNFGYIIDLNIPGEGDRLDKMEKYEFRRLLLPLNFSSDGQKIIGDAPCNCSGGFPDEVYMWDIKTRKLIIPDTADSNFNFLSGSGKKMVSDSVESEGDLKIIDLERKDTISLDGSKEYAGSNLVRFAPGDQFVYIYHDQAVIKWETSTGRLLFTLFPVDSTAFLTRIPSGYYACGPDAARSLHYLKGLEVINFTQLDTRYNRPDKLLEHIQYPDTALISAYRTAYVKRLGKLGIDSSNFKNDYEVPEADFVNREKIGDEQKEEILVLHIKASGKNYLLDHLNIWINGVPLYGLKGINILPGKIKNFDTTITVTLTPGENRIETSVTNINGMESFRTPLIVKCNAAKPLVETTYFIGIGIKNFSEPGHQLNYSVKDMRDLSAGLKSKAGNNFRVLDTLFDEKVTVSRIRDLKKKLMQTTVNDKVIIAYSGHGLLSKNFDYYLSTYDINFSSPEINGLYYDELENLLDSIPARKKLLLIDACFSGEVDKEEMLMLQMLRKELGDTSLKGGEIILDTANRRLGIKNSVELMQQLFANVGKSTGTVIIAASAGTQPAREGGGLKNSVFTYCVLEAMKKYPAMNAGRLNQVVSRRVNEITHGLQRSTLRNEQKDIDWRLW